MTATTTVRTGPIDRDRLAGLLNAAVAEYGPRHVYRPPNPPESCLYVHNRTEDNPSPGCIIGVVWFKHFGTLLPVELEGTAADALDCWADQTAADIAKEVQGMQDEEVAWGDAVRAALARKPDETHDAPQATEG
jgi:hypothetical protein